MQPTTKQNKTVMSEQLTEEIIRQMAEEIKHLRAKVEELTMDNMTHEYNNAEAEKFAPEFERQIREEEREKLQADHDQEVARYTSRIKDLEKLLYEVCVRANIIFPATPEALDWFEEKFANKTELLSKIDNELKHYYELP